MPNSQCLYCMHGLPHNIASVTSFYGEVVTSYLSTPGSRKWYVAEIGRFKRHRNDEHEYLVVSVEHEDYGKFEFQVERICVEGTTHEASKCKEPLVNLSNSVEEPDNRQPSEAQVESSASDPTPGPQTPSPPAAGVDNLNESANKPGATQETGVKDYIPNQGQIQLDSVDLHDNPMRRVDFACLAQTVHHYVSVHPLLNTQCSCQWFDYVILRIIAREHGQEANLPTILSPQAVGIENDVQEVMTEFHTELGLFQEKSKNAVLTDEERLATLKMELKRAQRERDDAVEELTLMRRRRAELERWRANKRAVVAQGTY